jgi:uncharacterized membrane protein YfcA
MTILRWIAFIPAGIISSVIASALFGMSAFMFPDFVSYFVTGASGAIGLIIGGLYVAPKRNTAVKNTMIVLTVILGVLSTAGSLIAGENMQRVSNGIFMVLFALFFLIIPANEILNPENRTRR